jgi:hypothetical protein
MIGNHGGGNSPIQIECFNRTLFARDKKEDSNHASLRREALAISRGLDLHEIRQ